MGKFGIGARVRDRHFGKGTVTDKTRGMRFIDFDECHKMWVSKPSLEPISDDWLADAGTFHLGKLKLAEPVAACEEKCEVAFSVGDRVFYDDGFCAGVGVIYSTAASVLGGSPRFDWAVTVDVKDREWAYYVDHTCRLFEASSLRPFTIEAGKFYRTRDGRKVGPMRIWDADVEHPFDDNGSDDVWRRDGTSIYQPDIVAEWTEPEAVKSEPEPKTKAEPGFKLGDRIIRVGNDTSWAPIGFRAVVQPGRTYTDKFGNAGVHMVPGDWALVRKAEPAPAPTFTVKAGGSYRGKSGAIYQVVDNSDNEFWPLTNAAKDRFWKPDGSAYNDPKWNGLSLAGDTLVGPKFKIGDRVRIVRVSGSKPASQIGREFTITIKDGPDHAGWSGSCDESPYWWPEDDLELVTSGPDIPAVGTQIILAGTLSGKQLNGGNVSVTFETATGKRSFDVPASSIRTAA